MRDPAREREVQRRVAADVAMGLELLEAWPTGMLPASAGPVQLTPPVPGLALGDVAITFERPMLLRLWQAAVRFGTTWQAVAVAALALANDKPTLH